MRLESGEGKEDISHEDYLEKMANILTRYNGVKCNTGPAQITDHLYLGSKQDANNKNLLRRLKITHILNCAAEVPGGIDPTNPYDEETGVRDYMELAARDNPDYPIMMHFTRAREFVNKARDAGGRALVHCELGVNRSAALCVAYLMDSERLNLIRALRQIKIDRPNILSNEGFRRQLIEFAENRNLLHSK